MAPIPTLTDLRRFQVVWMTVSDDLSANSAEPPALDPSHLHVLVAVSDESQRTVTELRSSMLPFIISASSIELSDTRLSLRKFHGRAEQ